VVNLKVKAEIVERLNKSLSNVKFEEIKMEVIAVLTGREEFIAIIVASRDTSSKNVSNSRKRTHNLTMLTIILLVTVTSVIAIGKTVSHEIWFLQQHRLQKRL
jgi:hypothetical protein